MHKWSFEGSTFLHLVEKVFSRCDPEETQLFVGISRHLWLRRNDFVFGKIFQHPNSLVNGVKDYVAEFMKVTERRSMERPSTVVMRETKWKASTPEWLKANWDASNEKNLG